VNTRRRPSEAFVTKFLRDTLAADGVAVPKLEGMARGAAQGQHITQTKVFRRAKNSLGIRSVRDGFGVGGGWSWELPRSSEGEAPSPLPIRPQPIRKERLIPQEWIEGVARLEHHRPPADVPRHHWRQFVEDCRAFMKSEQLASRAAELGWNAMALFGCRPNYPPLLSR
jgi:hypothetical protein